MMKLLEFYSLIVYNTPRDYTMEDQERELLEGYRKLGPEAKRFIMSTVITAVTAENAIKRQYGLPEGNRQEGTVLQGTDGGGS